MESRKYAASLSMLRSGGTWGGFFSLGGCWEKEGAGSCSGAAFGCTVLISCSAFRLASRTSVMNFAEDST